MYNAILTANLLNCEFIFLIAALLHVLRRIVHSCHVYSVFVQSEVFCICIRIDREWGVGVP